MAAFLVTTASSAPDLGSFRASGEFLTFEDWLPGPTLAATLACEDLSPDSLATEISDEGSSRRRLVAR